jgi:TP901 family phage tail tape measure protein
MATKSFAKLKITATENVSKTVGKIQQKFRPLTRTVGMATKKFAVFQRRTEGLRKSMSKLGSKMRSMGRGMATKVSAPIGLAGAAVLRTAVNFEKSMNKVGALSQSIKVMGDGTFKTTEQFNKLEKQAKELGSTTAFSASEAADAMGFLAQAGFKVEKLTKTGEKVNEIYSAMPHVLNLAAASSTDLAMTADIASNIMGGFQIEATEMARVADTLALVTATSNTNLEQLGEAMKQGAPLAKKFGVSLENTAALSGLLGNIGIQGSLAGTTLKAMFTKLAAPSSKAVELMKRMGFELEVMGDDGKKKIKPINDILAELGPTIGNLNQADQLAVINELFGLRGIAGASDLLAQSVAKGENPIKAFTKVLENSTGASSDMAKIMMRGAPGAVKSFTSALEGLALSIASSGLLEKFTEILTSLTEMVRGLSGTEQKWLAFGTIIAGIAAVFGPVLMGIGSLISAFGGLTAIFGAVKVAAAFLFPIILKIGAIFMGPLGIIVAVVAVVYRLITAWDKLVSAFKNSNGFFNTIKNVGKTFFGFGDDLTKDNGKGPLTKEGDVFSENRPVNIDDALSGKSVANTMDINLNGFPQGTNVKAKGEGFGVLRLGTIGGAQ